MTVTMFILVLAATCTALMAGLFYAYSCSVTPGLSTLPDAGYIEAMRSINRAIQNPLFFTVFFGALILLPVSAYLSYSSVSPLRCWLLSSAATIYISGVFIVTAVGNVPLNNALEKFNSFDATKEDVAAQRTVFEARWNNLNLVRTAASTISLIRRRKIMVVALA